MQRRFSSDELWTIRNNIPVEKVVFGLGIPSKVVEGVYRFLCPCCGEFQTAVNPRTNLGRCFRCKKNFNTIEIVMTERKMPFVEAVHFLQKQFLNSSVPASLPALLLKVLDRLGTASDSH